MVTVTDDMVAAYQRDGVVLIKGAVPGPKGGVVLVRTATKGA